MLERGTRVDITTYESSNQMSTLCGRQRRKLTAIPTKIATAIEMALHRGETSDADGGTLDGAAGGMIRASSAVALASGNRFDTFRPSAHEQWPTVSVRRSSGQRVPRRVESGRTTISLASRCPWSFVKFLTSTVDPFLMSLAAPARARSTPVPLVTT